MTQSNPLAVPAAVDSLIDEARNTARRWSDLSVKRIDDAVDRLKAALECVSLPDVLEGMVEHLSAAVEMLDDAIETHIYDVGEEPADAPERKVVAAARQALQAIRWAAVYAGDQTRPMGPIEILFDWPAGEALARPGLQPEEALQAMGFGDVIGDPAALAEEHHRATMAHFDRTLDETRVQVSGCEDAIAADLDPLAIIDEAQREADSTGRMVHRAIGPCRGVYVFPSVKLSGEEEKG